MSQSDFYIGMRFNSFESLSSFIKEYEKDRFCNLKIRESRRIESVQKRFERIIKSCLIYYELTYICYFGPQYRKRSMGKRSAYSLKRDCPFKVSLRVTIDGDALEVRSLNNLHNHDCDPWTFQSLPSQRKIDLNDKVLGELVALGANKKLIQVKLNNETGKNISLKSIHNIKKFGSFFDDAERVVGILKNEYGCVVNVLTNNENHVCGIFFMDQGMRRALDFFPELMMIDATYKLLDSR